MCTEVKHGANPQWDAPIAPGPGYGCLLEGFYTNTHDLTAAGVARSWYQSNRPSKQMPELLGMRTAFLDWFFSEYERLGGTRAEAYEQVEWLVRMAREGKKCVVTATGWEVR